MSPVWRVAALVVFSATMGLADAWPAAWQVGGVRGMAIAAGTVVGLMVPLRDVGGHPLHAVWCGRATLTVVLESAIAASSLSWARVRPDVARFTSGCAPDRAGLGRSDPSTGPRTFAREVPVVVISSGDQPPGTFTRSAREIADIVASREVSPRGLGSGIRMIQSFISPHPSEDPR